MSLKDKLNTLLGNAGEGICKTDKKVTPKTVAEDFKRGIMTGDQRIWKMAFRTFLILILGTVAAAAIMADFVLENQFERFKKYNTIINPNGVTLTPGNYMIAGVMTVGKDHQKYFILTPFSGGLMFSTPAPAEMEIPKDTSDYYIHVKENRELTLQPNLAIKNPQLKN